VRDEILHHALHALVGYFFVHVREVVRKDGVEEKAADGSFEYFAVVLRVLFVLAWKNFYFRAKSIAPKSYAVIAALVVGNALPSPLRPSTAFVIQ
jgi:hypothetical protein